MAEAPRYTSTIVSSTDGDTVTGPIAISAIKVMGGGSGMTVNIKDAGSNVIFKSIVTANDSEFNPFEKSLQLRTQTYTVNISAGSGTIYIYTI